jgi:enoyl-CoA hydratase/carnithine racemase
VPEELLTAVDGGVATIRLNRPDRRNALNTAVLSGLRALFDRLDDDHAVRVVVVRGEGKAFCSGMDLQEMKQQQAATADPESLVTVVLRRLEASRHPTIAMVQGDAFAGGCELALHCDLRIAADPARFCMPLAKIGLVVPFLLGQSGGISRAHTRHMLLNTACRDGAAREVGLSARWYAADIDRPPMVWPAPSRRTPHSRWPA